MSRLAVIRDFMGHAIDAIRQLRSSQNHQHNVLSDKLDLILKKLGERDAKMEAIRNDHDTLARQVQQHERRLAGR